MVKYINSQFFGTQEEPLNGLCKIKKNKRDLWEPWQPTAHSWLNKRFNKSAAVIFSHFQTWINLCLPDIIFTTIQFLCKSTLHIQQYCTIDIEKPLCFAIIIHSRASLGILYKIITSHIMYKYNKGIYIIHEATVHKNECLNSLSLRGKWSIVYSLPSTYTVCTQATSSPYITQNYHGAKCIVAAYK